MRAMLGRCSISAMDICSCNLMAVLPLADAKPLELPMDMGVVCVQLTHTEGNPRVVLWGRVVAGQSSG